MLFKPFLNSDALYSLKVALAQAEMREVIFSCSFPTQFYERFAREVFTFRAGDYALLCGAVSEAAFGTLRWNDA